MSIIASRVQIVSNRCLSQRRSGVALSPAHLGLSLSGNRMSIIVILILIANAYDVNDQSC